MLDKKDFGIDHEKEDIYRAWEAIDLKKLDLEGARSGEKRLSEALDRAIDAGADKDVMSKILDEWKQYHDRATVLLKGGDFEEYSKSTGDPVKDFAEGSRDNADKGMHILGGKVDGFVKQKLEGIIKSAPELTGKILAAHEKVVEVFHEKQEALAKSLHKAIDSVKLNTQNLSDMAKVNRWIKAVDAVEKYDAQHEGKIGAIKEKQTASVDKISGIREARFAANREAYEKTVSDIKEGMPTAKDRIKAGMDIINDAKKGAPFKDYFSKEALDARAGENLKAAKEALEKGDSKVSKISSLKLNVVNAWAEFQVKLENHHGKSAHAKAERAKAELDKIKSPEIKDIASKIASIKSEKGGTLREAKASMKDAGKKETPGAGPGDR